MEGSPDMNPMHFASCSCSQLVTNKVNSGILVSSQVLPIVSGKFQIMENAQQLHNFEIAILNQNKILLSINKSFVWTLGLWN